MVSHRVLQEAAGAGVSSFPPRPDPVQVYLFYLLASYNIVLEGRVLLPKTNV